MHFYKLQKFQKHIVLKHYRERLVQKEFFHFEVEWKGKGKKELGLNKKNKDVLVKVDPYYFRPNEVEDLLGDSTKAMKKLKWKSKTDLDTLVEIMMKHDLKHKNL